MTTERNKRLVEELAAAHPANDVERARRILSPKLKWHMVASGETMGRDEYLAGLESGNRAFADSSFTLDDIVAEGDRVAVRATYRGRHVGEFDGIAPTNRTITFTSMWFYRIVEDQVVEAWNVDQDFVKQLR